MAVKVVVVYNRRYQTINVYIHGLEELFKILKKYNFEQGDEEDGTLWWFGYPEDVKDMMTFVEELKKVADSVEYVEEQ
jgi:hypothetical protein